MASKYDCTPKPYYKEFWLYSVNGKSGEIACDKQTTTNTDKVKWEYKGF